MEKLIEVMQQQMLLQEKRYEELQKRSEEQHSEQLQVLKSLIRSQPHEAEHEVSVTTTSAVATPNFPAFDSTLELWSDYWSRFSTFTKAHSVPQEKTAKVFLTNQTSITYKMLSNLAAQESPPKDINNLTVEQITNYMKKQFDPKRFVVRERFKFWNDMTRKPGESIQELATRIRQAAATCDFSSITNPLDEALRTRFICAINNEAVLKALFKIKADELTFARAIEIATETEDAAKVAKETVFGSPSERIHKVKSFPQAQKRTSTQPSSTEKNIVKCYRCGKVGHLAPDCYFKTATCNYCKIQGHLESVCRKKKNKTSANKVKSIYACNVTKSSNNFCRVPRLQVPVYINSQQVCIELDTATGGNFLSEEVWNKLGKPNLQPSSLQFQSASQHVLPVLGTFVAQTASAENENGFPVQYSVSKIPHLNLLGRDAIATLNISIDNLMFSRSSSNTQVKALSPSTDEQNVRLQKACAKLCDDYSELFKPELGCLKNFELEVQFNPEAKPVFCKPRSVPFAMQTELTQVLDAGVKKGIWTPVQFNDWGTPIVPVRKRSHFNTSRSVIRVCGDYSATVNPQLATHRHPLPRPEELMQKLGGGFKFTKIDLADAYNQVRLAPESRKRLALSTHRGVFLQNVLPFGISSAPGYFQKIMDDITKDLPGVAVYLDDILVSGKNEKDHLFNLKCLLQRLSEHGLRCRKEKCEFAKPSVEYLGHVLSQQGISKGTKVDAVLKMPAPKDVSTLRSFLGSVQFYGKFLPSCFSTDAAPLYKLLRRDVSWKWGPTEAKAFNTLKELLSSDSLLIHFDPSLPIGIACDASSVGIGATLFHRFSNGDEKPIANVSKLLTASQRNYSQIQKEALSIIFALKKFYQYLYGRSFIIVTDHKPLLTLFASDKPVPGLAANRLARWALFLGQFQYSLEFRKTNHHQNADALSRLPSSEDPIFDEEEEEDDSAMVCSIETLSLQIQSADASLVKKETSKDPVLGKVMLFTREGWPSNLPSDDPVQQFRRIADSLSNCQGCLLYGTRLVIPSTLRKQVLQLLHTSHLGMQRMKQLARTAVYWPNIDSDIVELCRSCISCCEHRNAPAKLPNHPWILPEKPWSRVHVDHAINFMGQNWLVMVDAFSKYPCIHPVSSISSKATLDLLEENFAHFGYPHSIVSDNATCFTSDEFQSYCKERNIVHLTGAPYHPSSNGAAERLIQTFKQALRKSSKTPRRALQEFLMQYRRTPTASGYSPSELLNNRQLRSVIDTLFPSAPHIAQSKLKSSDNKVSKTGHQFKIGDPCYALYFGPRRNQDPRWVPALIIKKQGSRMFHVRVIPKGPIWRRHINQLQPRYVSDSDNDIEDMSYSFDTIQEPVSSKSSTEENDLIPSSSISENYTTEQSSPSSSIHSSNSASSTSEPQYTRENPRRSNRTRRRPDFYCA